MSLPIRPLLGILADNLRKRGSVLPLSRKKAVGWAKGLDLPRGGETVLYTGHIYQLMPAIARLEETMVSMEHSWKRKFLGVGRTINRAVNVSAFMVREDPEMRAVFEGRLVCIAKLLRRAGVAFGYLYEDELYSGALIHDQGVDDVFVDHARRVAKILSENGVRRVITVDPHTTNIMRTVFPEVLPGFDVEVKSWLEILDGVLPASDRPLGQEVVIHDSCVYARSENVLDEPRRLLQRAGASIREPEFSGRRTLCCGGPIESLFPSRARSICSKRMDQLERMGERIVAMCPICLVNLERVARDRSVVVNDICEVLAEAYGLLSPDQIGRMPSASGSPVRS
jgi:Fe-S oxidoreductase